MKTKAPDIATGFTVHDEHERAGFSSRFRVDTWMKAVPVRFQSHEKEKYLRKIMRNLFLEYHPDWHHEYKLLYCTRQEATHVSGSGVCGTIVALNDKRVEFTHEYIGWNKETIDEHREYAEDLAQKQKEDEFFALPHVLVKGRWHF